MKSQTISVQIDRTPAEVYAFASNPENLPKWVRSFCLSVKRSGGEWQMETPTGWVGIRFVSANEFGVLDHIVTLPDGQSILNPTGWRHDARDLELSPLMVDQIVWAELGQTQESCSVQGHRTLATSDHHPQRQAREVVPWQEPGTRQIAIRVEISFFPGAVIQQELNLPSCPPLPHLG
jgi:hypothetical protein